MECDNHPDKEAIATCSVCGKAVCQDCSMEIAGNIYCKDCVNEIVTKSILENAVKGPKNDAKQSLAEETVEEKPVETIAPVQTEEVIEPITPIQAEEKVVEPIEKAPENFETDFEYETEYVETYEENGAEDSYYENPEPIPEPEPEYIEQKRKLEEEALKSETPIKPVHTGDIDEDYYQEPMEKATPSNELEAKYERYLEDLYYDEEAPQEEIPQRRERRERRPRNPRREEYDDYYEAPRRPRRPRNYVEEDMGEPRGEYYINPRDEEYLDDDLIVPSHSRPRREAESYEELKRRIERNYEREQEQKKRGRFRRSKKSKKEYDDELESIQEMHRFDDDFGGEDGRLSITEIILAIILILLIILLILYVIYLFRLSGEYGTFFDALLGLVQNPNAFIANVLN